MTESLSLTQNTTIIIQSSHKPIDYEAISNHGAVTINITNHCFTRGIQAMVVPWSSQGPLRLALPGWHGQLVLRSVEATAAEVGLGGGDEGCRGQAVLQ